MSTIRDLTPDESGLGWLYGKFDSESLFKGEMKITIYGNDDKALAYAEKCVADYNSLADNAALLDDIRGKLTRFMLYMRDEWEQMDIYEDIAEDSARAARECAAGKDVISLLTSPCLTAELPEDDCDEIGYEIDADCPWEPEHQCSMIIRSGEVKYVGPCEGNTPWDDDDEYYCIWLDDNGNNDGEE